MQAPLEPRRGRVLRAIVVEHIRTAEPVGSGAIATRYRLGVSSATIRNEMSSLEELGFLRQPHTSAGRVPTDSGYRYYVDTLPGRADLREAQRQAIARFFGQPVPDIDETLRRTIQFLSRMTHHASLAMAPSLRQGRIARVDLVRIGAACLLLVVTDTGRVEKRVLELRAETAVVERVARELASSFAGLSLEDAVARANELADTPGTAAKDATLLRRVAEGFGSMEGQASSEHVMVGGAANIAADVAFDRRESLERVFTALEREADLLRMLDAASRATEVTVTIGRENPVTGMWETSVVIAPYGAADRPLGMIGIIGPTRMDYPANISAVGAVARRLSEVMAALAS